MASFTIDIRAYFRDRPSRRAGVDGGDCCPPILTKAQSPYGSRVRTRRCCCWAATERVRAHRGPGGWAAALRRNGAAASGGSRSSPELTWCLKNRRSSCRRWITGPARWHARRPRVVRQLGSRYHPLDGSRVRGSAAAQGLARVVLVGPLNHFEAPRLRCRRRCCADRRCHSSWREAQAVLRGS